MRFLPDGGHIRMIPAMTRSRIPVVALAMALAAVASPALAQRASLAERVATLEQRAAGDRGNIELLNQITALKSEVAALRAQIEELQQQNEQARSTARAQYLDLDGRMTRLEGGVPASGALQQAPTSPPLGGGSAAAGSDITFPSSAGARTDAGTALPPPAPSADERASYEAAFDVLKAGQYDESARAFLQFLQAHPNGSYAPNARYWLGESYYVTGNYQLALEQFRLLQQQYPQHAKAPGALLKIGLSQYGLQQLGEAEATLTEVTRLYPGSDAARTAEDRLRAIALQLP
jgi:tol-pal system protein YbgF